LIKLISWQSPEAAVVQLFEEVKRHKPSVIYLPSIDIWYETMGQQVIKTFNGLLRTLSPTDPILVLGVMELRSNQASPNQEMMRELFSRSRKNYFLLDRPGEVSSTLDIVIFRLLTVSSRRLAVNSSLKQ